MHAFALKRAKKKNRVPKWADRSKIKEIYLKCPSNKQVDHIIPLCGDLVSGLHVPENLQYLTKNQNHKKGNDFEPIIEIYETTKTTSS